MELLIFLIKSKLYATWQDLRLSKKILNTLFFLYILSMSIIMGYFLHITIGKQDSQTEIIQLISYYGRFIILTFVITAYFIPYLVPVARKINPVYPISRMKIFILNLYMDITFSRQVLLSFLFILGIFIMNPFTLLQVFISLCLVIVISVILSRIIQNLFNKESNPFANIVCLGIFGAYVYWSLSQSENASTYFSLIDLGFAILLFFGAHFSDKKVGLNKAPKQQSKLAFNQFWWSILFNNKLAKKQLIGMLIFPIISIALNLVNQYTDYSFKESTLALPVFYFFLMPSGFLISIFNNFWVSCPQLFRNMDMHQSGLKSYYTQYTKATLSYILIHFPLFIAYCLISKQAIFIYTFNYIIILISMIPIGLYFSTHRSKKISDGFGQKNKASSIAVVVGTGISMISYLFFIYLEHYFYLNAIFLLVGVIFHYLLKEDLEQDRYRIHQVIKGN